MYTVESLSNTQAEEVILDVSLVIEAIGLAETERLSILIVEVQSPRNIKRNSAIPPEKRVTRQGLGKFPRLELIKAIQNANSRSSDAQRTSESPPGGNSADSMGEEDNTH